MAAQNGWLKTEDRADGPTWVYCFYATRPLDGKRVQQKVALGLVENLGKSKPGAWAEVERQKLITRINNQTVTGKRLTFSELAAQYQETQVPALAATTQYLHRHIITDYLLPRWGGRPALDIKPVELQEWVQALAATLATPTRAKIRDILHRIFAWGVRFSILPLGTPNPVEPVECRRQPGEKKYEPELLTAAQAASLVQSFPLS